MCKVVAFTNSTKLDVKKSAEVIGNILLQLEKDGFGYAVQGAENIFGEKCIASKFTPRLGLGNEVKLPIIEQRQSTFGYADKPTGPAIFHGRTSTNDKGLLNCHPMQRDKWHLIHNGVVTDHGPKYQKQTTNDSEDVLHRLISGIKDVERYLSGYYAFAAIDPKGRLHIGRDSIASLYVAWLPKVQSFIFATTEGLLDEVCQELKLKHGPIDKVMNDIYMIFEGNELVHQEEIRPLGYSARESNWASHSLGRKLDGTNIVDLSGQDSLVRNLKDMNDEADYADLMRELEMVDNSYLITDFTGKTISAAEFHKLDEISKLDCEIMRPDGTIISIDNDYYYRRA